jgi:hypothetical protein
VILHWSARLGPGGGFSALAPIPAAAPTVAPTAGAFARFDVAAHRGGSLRRGGGFDSFPRWLGRARLARRALPIRVALPVAPVVARRAAARFAPRLALPTLRLTLPLRLSLPVLGRIVARRLAALLALA